ncbi:DUF2813 domain-containing protein, partial [Chryseobacterium indologenes]|uniref:AAA family ATPase n=1 Tax=Chryseobacterium indologenes TaxID=253 RepID=UPI0011098EE0
TMVLKEIQIKNFRSIKDENIAFNHNCIILLGKNEAGKSNILKAIAAVFGEYKVSNKDKRKRVENEKINEYLVRAVFKLDENDFKKIVENFKKKFSGTELIIFKNKITLLEYVKKIFHEFLIRLDISDNNTPVFRRWTYYEKDLNLEKELYINSTIISTDSTIGTKLNLEKEFHTIVNNYYNNNPI